MESDKESTPIWSRSGINKTREYVLEASLGLKRIASTIVTGNFSKFKNKSRGTMCGGL